MRSVMWGQVATFAYEMVLDKNFMFSKRVGKLCFYGLDVQRS